MKQYEAVGSRRPLIFLLINQKNVGKYFAISKGFPTCCNTEKKIITIKKLKI